MFELAEEMINHIENIGLLRTDDKSKDEQIADLAAFLALLYGE